MFLRDDQKRNGRKFDVKLACIHFVDERKYIRLETNLIEFFDQRNPFPRTRTIFFKVRFSWQKQHQITVKV